MSRPPLVPPLALATRLPQTQRERLSMYATPRGVIPYSPRTHRERLELAGSCIEEALAAAAEIAEAVALLSARAACERADFAADAASTCPICMDAISEPLSCERGHQVCGACLRRIYRHSRPQLSCPLCRVAISPAILC